MYFFYLFKCSITIFNKMQYLHKYIWNVHLKVHFDAQLCVFLRQYIQSKWVNIHTWGAHDSDRFLENSSWKLFFKNCQKSVIWEKVSVKLAFRSTFSSIFGGVKIEFVPYVKYNKYTIKAIFITYLVVIVNMMSTLLADLFLLYNIDTFLYLLYLEVI